MGEDRAGKEEAVPAWLENPEVDPRGPGAKGVNWARSRGPPSSFEARELNLHMDVA